MSLSLLTHRLVPPQETPGKLVIVLHGRGDSMDGFSWLPKALDQPGLGYLFLNAPDEYYGGYSWYALAPNQAPGVLRSRELLFGVLDELIAQGWASEDLILFGFSQGCLMSVDVGLRYGRPLGGVCGVSGFVMFPERAAAEAQPHARTMPWLITHGTHDQVLPIVASRAHVHQLQAAGIPVAWHEFPKDHTIELRHELAIIRDWMRDRLAAAPRSH